MTELLEVVVAWPTLLIAVTVFGFMPGFFLRCIVKIYPPHDPRRKELVAELYIYPRLERPFFVAEQLETALHEGMPWRFGRVLGHIPAVRRRRAQHNLETVTSFLLRESFGLDLPADQPAFLCLNDGELEVMANEFSISMDEMLRLATPRMYARWRTSPKEYTVMEWLQRRSHLRLQRYSKQPLPRFSQVPCLCTCDDRG